MTELHPDPCRPLTSRELARIIGSLLGFQCGFMQGQNQFLLAASEIEEATEQALRFVRGQVDAFPAWDRASYLELASSDPAVSIIAAAVLATLIDLGDMAPQAEAAAALDWWLSAGGLQVLAAKSTAIVGQLVPPKRPKLTVVKPTPKPEE